MTHAGSQWLRDRVRDFRDRAEAAENENTRARLLSAAVIYADQAESIETIDRFVRGLSRSHFLLR
jgi:hypothetical protein